VKQNLITLSRAERFFQRREAKAHQVGLQHVGNLLHGLLLSEKLNWFRCFSLRREDTPLNPNPSSLFLFFLIILKPRAE
jgi:hypothetical protein